MEYRFFTWGAALIVSVHLTGCASVNDKALRLFSAQAKAHAVVNGQVLTGLLDLLPDRTGSASLVGTGESPVRCAGSVRYTGSTSGSIVLHCSDGALADLQFTAMTETSGYAYSQTGQDKSSLTYGMQPIDAIALLRPPAGKKLVVRADGEGLELQ